MPRLLFEKTGNAVWISHLDLMRVFQRAFKRAGLMLTHTQGFNPRPSVSIALPLSVGVESRCELLDFELDGQPVSCEEIKARLQKALISGVNVLDVYENGAKIKHLALMDCTVSLIYDSGVPVNARQRIGELFTSPSLIMEKKNRNGVTQQDIIPMIKRMEILQSGAKLLLIHARICCQNPTLNPMQMVAAIGKFLPDLTPDHSVCHREEIYYTEENIFR